MKTRIGLIVVVVSSGLAATGCRLSPEQQQGIRGQIDERLGGDAAGTLGALNQQFRAGRTALYLIGSFSSAAQAEADPENFFDIRLRVVRIWDDRDEGYWLYVEQAAASALDRPYRQRVYLVQSGDRAGEVVSRVFTLPEPLRWAGAWADPSGFDSISPDDLAEREGCAVYLRWESDLDAFVGSTRGTGCTSSLGGAAYGTSEVVLRSDGMTSWDRGFDAGGNQVWGATEGPYEFVRDPG